MKTRETRRVAVLVFEDVQSLDVTGPLEVFATAAQVLLATGARRDLAYTTEVVALAPGAVRASSGIGLIATAPRGRYDTLLVAGGSGTRRLVGDDAVRRAIRRLATRARRFGAVCTGAFLLADAGLLDGRRAATHWQHARNLAARFPAVDVDDDVLFIRDGALCTSAGVTAGIDLALALVEEDHGRKLALEVARQLVVFLQRPGGQSQFSAHLAAQSAERPALRDVQHYVVENLAHDLRVPALARRVGLSPRQLARTFVAEIGQTPARFVEDARVEAARRRLEQTSCSVDEIARACGFGSAESMRRAFLRNVQIAPSDYRDRFKTTTERKRISR